MANENFIDKLDKEVKKLSEHKNQEKKIADKLYNLLITEIQRVYPILKSYIPILTDRGIDCELKRRGNLNFEFMIFHKGHDPDKGYYRAHSLLFSSWNTGIYREYELINRVQNSYSCAYLNNRDYNSNYTIKEIKIDLNTWYPNLIENRLKELILDYFDYQKKNK